MRTAIFLTCAALGLTSSLAAADFQGLIVDRTCAVDMVKNGRPQTLKARPDCSLNKGHYSRSAYALITDEKKLFYLDQAGNDKALNLLKNTPDPDALRVIVTGDVDGQTIKVQTMSML